MLLGMPMGLYLEMELRTPTSLVFALGALGATSMDAYLNDSRGCYW